MSPSPDVAKTKLLLENAKARLNEAEAVVRSISHEVQERHTDYRNALVEADRSYPVCRAIHYSWHDRRAISSHDVVILKRNPAGSLSIRELGQPEAKARIFKWDTWSKVYREAKSSTSSRLGYYELSDVPAEFMPQATVSELECEPSAD